MKIGRSEGLRKGWPMECMHDLRPDPEVSPPEIPPKLTPGRLFDKLWSATTGSPKVWSEKMSVCCNLRSMQRVSITTTSKHRRW